MCESKLEHTRLKIRLIAKMCLNEIVGGHWCYTKLSRNTEVYADRTPTIPKIFQATSNIFDNTATC